MSTLTLYGSPMSLYTGRARSYLIKAGLAYREEPPGSRHFRETVLRKAGGRRSLPTLEFPDGRVIRDGVAIVDHFERERGHPCSPTSPVQRIVSRLFDAIGAEGLLRPAMHYRWHFDDLNLDFLRFQFQTIFLTPEATEARFHELRDGVTVMFGAAPDAIEVIETLYRELLVRLNAHFSRHPYLLGGRPCIGDFGMIAPLYGHLGRDPAPLALMQARAPRVFRWVERMNRPELDDGEFEERTDAYLADDAIPDSLIQVLKQLAIDFVPETRAACACINDWLAQQPGLAPGTTAERGVGMADFELRGTKVSALAQPFRFYVLKRVQDEFEALGASDRGAVEALLDACDMREVLDLKLTREIGRQNNLEVWL